MMLEMYINNIRIDSTEVDFRFCDTLQKRESRVEELCFYLSKIHFSKAFISHVTPNFYLVAGSKANDIIAEDYFINGLVPQLESELKNKKSS